MAERVYTEEVEERPRETVVVERDGSSGSRVGLIILAIIIIALLIFFLIGNPFSNNSTTPDVNVDVPTPTVTTPTTDQQ